MNKYAVITMDVEDWYQSYFMEYNVDRSQSLLDGLDIALDIMDSKGIKGSFFVVGELVGQLQDKLRRMDKAGHDIACHSWEHLRPLSMAADEFEQQLQKAKQALETALGHKISGYRAPCFGIDDERLEIVRGMGFDYDSSKLKPQLSKKYGELRLKGYQEVFPCIHQKDGFTEFEVSTQKLGPMNMLLGGGYIRMLPWPFMKWMTHRYLNTGKPYVMYIHPIDLSPKPIPKVVGITFDKYLRTHLGRRHMVWRFKKVIGMLEKSGYTFVTFEQLRKEENLTEDASV